MFKNESKMRPFYKPQVQTGGGQVASWGFEAQGGGVDDQSFNGVSVYPKETPVL